MIHGNHARKEKEGGGGRGGRGGGGDKWDKEKEDIKCGEEGRKENG